MKLHTLSLALVLLVPFGCDSKPADSKADAKAGDAKAGDAKAGDAKAGDVKAAKADDGDTLPTEIETLALDQGESKIPATIDVPKGSTTFNDDPTTIRIEWGEGRERGKLFGVQIAKGNEFNTNLGDLEAMMLKNEYGNTNVIVEKTDTLLRYTMQREGGEPSHKFQMILELGGEKWVCKDGNRGGWTEETIKRQLEACKTLKAK